MIFLSESFVDVGFYLFFLSIFHTWEYIYVALFHPQELSIDSFLLNHSNEYSIALISSWAEYIVERLFMPSSKGHWPILVIGVLICLGGQIIRILAMYTAGKNFHHQIRLERDKSHKLVCSGIYSLLRHPSYFGWFYWSIGTQIILLNPICFCGFAFYSWRFFYERIREEEDTLIAFFGEDYIRYRAQTPVGIPGIP